MSTINWATGQSGTWTTASDWSGGAVPGPSDVAVIDAVSSHLYTVTLNSPVAVGGLVLDAAKALLLVDGSLSSPAIDVESGILALGGGTLAGTITQTGGEILAYKYDSTLDNVTLAGDVTFAAGQYPATLTILDALNLTGVNGSGPGTVAFNSELVLDGVSVLDNATITTTYNKGLFLGDKTPLTLGSHLELSASDIFLTNGQSIINDGTLSVSVLSGGALTNNGTMNETAESNLILADSFTNNGLITVDSLLTLELQGLNAAGAGSSIELEGGTLTLDGTLTTAQLLATFAAQHVIGTGAYGFGVDGELDNSNTILQVGAGTTLGGLDGADVIGGTIVANGGSSIYGSLNSLTLKSTTNTLSVSGTLTNVDITKAKSIVADMLAIAGGTLSGIGTITAYYLSLGGTTISGAGKSGHPVIKMQNVANAGIFIGATQSVAGYIVDFTADSQSLLIAGGAALDGATLNVGPTGSNGDSIFYSFASTAGVSLGTHFDINVAAGGYLILDGNSMGYPPASILTNAGTMTIAGTLAVGGAAGGNTIANLDNTGAIDISSGGNFVMGIDAANILTNSGLIAATNGTLDLLAVTNTGDISATFKAAPGTATIGGPLTGAGTVALTGTGTLALGGTVAAGQLISLSGRAETLLFSSTTADTGFQGTIGGFAKGDSITFTGETLTAASFLGASIVATLSTGGTIALATTSALSGGLSVTNANGEATITYSSKDASDHGWPAASMVESKGPTHWQPLGVNDSGLVWNDEKPLVWALMTHAYY